MASSLGVDQLHVDAHAVTGQARCTLAFERVAHIEGRARSASTSAAFPLYVKAVLRAMTNAPEMRERSVVRLSGDRAVDPKYSCSGSPPILANGSTMRERCGAPGFPGDAADAGLTSVGWPTSNE